MSLHPKMYGLRGLRATLLIYLSGCATCTCALGAVLFVDSTRTFAICSAGAFLGTALWSSRILTPFSEAMLRLGLPHAWPLIRYFTIPVIGAIAVTAWLAGVSIQSSTLGSGWPTDSWVAGAARLSLLVALGLGQVVLLASLAYTWFVYHHRARHVRGWSERLAVFSRHYPADALARIERFIAREVDSDPPAYAAQGSRFPGLSVRAFHDELQRPAWMEELEERFATVREELLQLVASGDSTPDGGFFRFQKSHRLFRFRYSGERCDEVCALCPETAAILDRNPTNSDIVVAVLYPGARLRNHIDFSAPNLCYHLGIEIPPGCFLRAGEETRAWIEGEGFIFDNSLEHEAWNDGDAPRIVLLVDFPHPELTAAERAFFTTGRPDVAVSGPGAAANPDRQRDPKGDTQGDVHSDAA